MRSCPLVLALAALLAGGCATSLSTMQPYETLRPGAVHFSTGYSINAPVSQSVRSIKSAIALGRHLSAETSREGGVVHPGGARGVPPSEWAEVGAAAMAVALSTPGYNNEYMGRIGVIEDVDVGIRWAWSTLRLDGKVQLYRYKPSRRFDMGLSLDVGAGYHFFDGAVFDVLSYLNIDEFRRFDAEASLIAGMSWGTYDSFQIWFGPKMMLSAYHVDGSLGSFCAPKDIVCADQFRLVDPDDTNGGMGLYGGFVGAAVGYRWVWFMVEMTGMWMVAKHHILPGLTPEKTDLGGLVLFPSAGFMVRFEF